jgi:TusA-related sulfurtransferase
MNFDKELDARGLNCPLPILRAKKTLAELQPGQVLRIIATDPGSVKGGLRCVCQANRQRAPWQRRKGQGVRVFPEAQVIRS